MTTYIIGTEGSLSVKIGYTGGTLKQRLSQLQAGNREKLIVLMTLEKDYEKALHRHFAEYRIPGTEWFDMPSDPVELIKEAVKVLSPWPPKNPNLPPGGKVKPSPTFSTCTAPSASCSKKVCVCQENIFG